MYVHIHLHPGYTLSSLHSCTLVLLQSCRSGPIYIHAWRDLCTSTPTPDKCPIKMLTPERPLTSIKSTIWSATSIQILHLRFMYSIATILFCFVRVHHCSLNIGMKFLEIPQFGIIVGLTNLGWMHVFKCWSHVRGQWTIRQCFKSILVRVVHWWRSGY